MVAHVNNIARSHASYNNMPPMQRLWDYWAAMSHKLIRPNRARHLGLRPRWVQVKAEGKVPLDRTSMAEFLGTHYFLNFQELDRFVDHLIGHGTPPFSCGSEIFELLAVDYGLASPLN